jgi:hypothetical protein
MAIFFKALYFLSVLLIFTLYFFYTATWSLLGFLAAAFLVCTGFFLISANTLVINFSTESTLAAFKVLSHLENYF